MTRVWQNRPLGDDDYAPCQRCGKDVLLGADPPCQHGTVACPECGHEAACRDCRRIEELNEWAEHIGPPLGVEFPGRTSAEVGAAVAEEQRRRQAQVEAIREADRQAGLAYKAWLEGRAKGEG
jgi:hypothetical protein